MLRGRLKRCRSCFPRRAKPQPPCFPCSARSHTIPHRTGRQARARGSFGYDLLFQFEPIPCGWNGASQRLRSFFCDDIIYMDRKREVIERFTYEFEKDAANTGDWTDRRKIAPWPAREPGPITSDHTPEEYMVTCRLCAKACGAGLLRSGSSPDFPCALCGKASDLFQKMQKANPSPYEFLIQFADEQLVGASPRCSFGWKANAWRLARLRHRGAHGRSAAGCEEHSRAAEFDEEESTHHVTDVDRNDKSRVCQPGTVKVIGRRLIESYRGCSIR